MQLVHDLGSLHSDVKGLYNTHIQKGTRPTRAEILKVLQSEVSRYSKVFVVVDALDEISEEHTRTILLTELRSLRPTVNLMATSRFLTPIARMFEMAEQLEVSATVEDVRKYIEARISRESRLSQLIRKSPALHEDIVNAVVGRSKKMYV
jgi:hypothetical protein